MANFHALSISQVLNELKTAKTGLSKEEASARYQQFGPNQLPKSGEKRTKLVIFFSQWKSPLIIILAIAGIISSVLGEYIDMTVISITVAVNVFIGFIQEYKASQALQKLSQMVVNNAIVMRNGKQIQIESSKVVPGDILMLSAGEKVQADARIIESVDLEVQEAVLTGESEPIKKHARQLKEDSVLGDRLNMVFNGTVIINGNAKAVVVGTGTQTEIGKIATLVKETKDEQTPLQQQLAKMARIIGLIVLFISTAIFIFGIFSSSGTHRFLEMFETAVAVAVAAIPEGLVISLTIILAIGMQHILKKKALVRKLLAAETLGSVSVICTDKTGTLTEGIMRLTQLITKSDNLNFEELKLVNVVEKDRHREAALALRIGVLCNDSAWENPEAEEKDWRFVGDTTDIALVYAGAKVGLIKQNLEQALSRQAEISFDSNSKYMATMHQIDHESVIYVKGAAEALYHLCSYYEEDGQTKKLTEKQLEWYKEKEESIASKGLRVLALAYKKEEKVLETLEKKDINDLVLVGLAAFSDPLRKDVKQTIEKAWHAGIKTIMITGDHKKTAQSIAEQLGIPHNDDQVFDGKKLEQLSDEELQLELRNVFVFARVDPKHKIRIVKALQASGEIVAMTGDGVNDAPALKGADIGVALGSGTAVAKEIADIVLLDDNFNTIVGAVEEGRGIYQNIKKVVLYLLSGSFAEVVLIAGSLIAGLPLAVLPVQILWVNLIEDSFPNMALAFDKGETENMKEKPRRKNESIIDSEMKIMITIISIVSNFALLGMFLYFWFTTKDIALTRTIIFVGLGIDSLLYIYSIRSRRRMIWNTNPFDNHYLTLAVAFGWLMLVSAVYLQPLQILLRTVSLSWQYWAILLVFGLLNVFLIEVVKWIFLTQRNKQLLINQ